MLHIYQYFYHVSEAVFVVLFLVSGPALLVCRWRLSMSLSEWIFYLKGGQPWS